MSDFRFVGVDILEQIKNDAQRDMYVHLINMAGKYGLNYFRYHVNFLRDTQGDEGRALSWIEDLLNACAENCMVLHVDPFVWNNGFDTSMCTGITGQAEAFVDQVNLVLKKHPMWAMGGNGNEWHAGTKDGQPHCVKQRDIANHILSRYDNDIRKCTQWLDGPISQARFLNFHSHVDQPSVRPTYNISGKYVIAEADTGHYTLLKTRPYLAAQYCRYMWDRGFSTCILLPWGFDSLNNEHSDQTKWIIQDIATQARNYGIL